MAYPQWQLTSGSVRCNECHYNPGGGGLINSYGRDAVGDQLSTFDGDGNLLHGSVTPPRWLALGADLRGAFVANGVQDPTGRPSPRFPCRRMWGARVAIPQGISVMATLGVRGITRDPNVDVTGQAFQPVSASRLISREHYVMWQPEVQGKYVRMGRFFAPYGLRFAEHVLYIRRDSRLRPAAGDLQPVGGVHVPEVGAARHGVRTRLRPPHRQRRDRASRATTNAGCSTTSWRWPARRASPTGPARRVSCGAASASSTSSSCGRCSSRRSTSSTSTSTTPRLAGRRS